jgi:hypothetical protein
VALAFLNEMDPAWKGKYVKSYVPVGGPFAGTVMNLMGVVSGEQRRRHARPAAVRLSPWLEVSVSCRAHLTPRSSSLRVSSSGYNLGIPIDASYLRNFEAAAPTGVWLMPHPLLWPASEVRCCLTTTT